MIPVLVFPLHDPENLLLPRLGKITPLLKKHFAKTFFGYTPSTPLGHLTAILKNDPFFQYQALPQNSPVGDHFRLAFEFAINNTSPETVLHLSVIDRLLAALNSPRRQQCLKDLDACQKQTLPLFFLRSDRAWKTHPQNYYFLENLLTTLGQKIFHRELDFAWCHLALKNHRLRQILPLCQNHDWTYIAEIVLLLLPKIKTKKVDWLTWEDPFIFGRPAAELKKERETSLTENQKRLSYVLPSIELLINRHFKPTAPPK